MAERINIELLRKDWEEIFYALEDKAKRIERGEYGPEESDGEDEDWIAHLQEIMAYIEKRLEHGEEPPKPAKKELSQRDRRRVIEMAEKWTQKVCRQRRITLFKAGTEDYTSAAQEIFNEAYDNFEAVVRARR